MKMLKFLVKGITKALSTNFFAKLLFGVDCSQSNIYYQIGFSTILMKKSLKKFVKPHDKVIDIGTGAFAIHAIWIKKNIGAEVTATEISDEYIESAKRVAKANKASIKVIKSDLFKSAKGNFDWAIFNPPFRGREDSDGYRITERLLKESPKNIKLMIVSNAFYADLRRIEGIIRDNGYAMIEVITAFLNPSKVYVIEKRT
ncbi:methyltransferase [Candidatus Woesearchaeota archaeon]|nr:methyltransferase [Candidatus Woesearchaeota archaeon]